MKKMYNKIGVYSKKGRKGKLKCWSRVKIAVILIKERHWFVIYNNTYVSYHNNSWSLQEKKKEKKNTVTFLAISWDY